jgi:hypothetical protein
VIADGRTTTFQVLQFALDFQTASLLDVSLVYHPGWHIDHPLEREGRAARLWPRHHDAELDLGALPAVSPDDTRWLKGPRVHFRDGAFATIARAPLAPTTLFVPQGGMDRVSW